MEAVKIRMKMVEIVLMLVTVVETEDLLTEQTHHSSFITHHFPQR